MDSFLDIPLIASIMAVATAMSGVFIITRYLQRGQLESSFTRKELERLRTELRETNSEYFNPKEIIKTVESLRNDFSHLKSDFTHINEKERARIVDSLKSSLTGDASQEILNSLKEEIRNEMEQKSKQSLVQNHFESTIIRLREELFSLTKRSNLNLALGIVTTVIGLAILGYFVLYSPTNFDQPIDFIESFGPRLSLVIFIEIFAFFFLRLYKDTLTEIKYFQNEITNVEAKHLAVTLAIESKEDNGVLSSIDSLLNTERNYILQKGQSTVEIERRKMEKDHAESTTGRLTSMINEKSK